MKSSTSFSPQSATRKKQQGLVLFLALVALVVLSLAAVALIRSVDTNTLIAGNLSFKQTATASGDIGVETGIAWLSATNLANSGKNVYTDLTHAFNLTDTTRGYYSSFDTALDLKTDGPWNAITNVPEVIDASNNRVRYIIQRMCRTNNAVVSIDDCLFSGAEKDINGKNVKLLQEICDGQGCPPAGSSPQLRITSRTLGPKNTVSYIQAFVY